MSVMDFLGDVANVVDSPAAFMRAAYANTFLDKGPNPFDAFFHPEKRIYGRDITGDPYSGFAFDVAMDPLGWPAMGLGAAKLGAKLMGGGARTAGMDVVETASKAMLPDYREAMRLGFTPEEVMGTLKEFNYGPSRPTPLSVATPWYGHKAEQAVYTLGDRHKISIKELENVMQGRFGAAKWQAEAMGLPELRAAGKKSLTPKEAQALVDKLPRVEEHWLGGNFGPVKDEWTIYAADRNPLVKTGKESWESVSTFPTEAEATHDLANWIANDRGMKFKVERTPRRATPRTEYGAYHNPNFGTENYHELLLTEVRPATTREVAARGLGLADDAELPNLSPEQWDEIVDKFDDMNNYIEDHWVDVPGVHGRNVFAHAMLSDVRLPSRAGGDTKKLLAVSEFQSKWGDALSHGHGMTPVDYAKVDNQISMTRRSLEAAHNDTVNIAINDIRLSDPSTAADISEGLVESGIKHATMYGQVPPASSPEAVGEMAVVKAAANMGPEARIHGSSLEIATLIDEGAEFAGNTIQRDLNLVRARMLGQHEHEALPEIQRLLDAAREGNLEQALGDHVLEAMRTEIPKSASGDFGSLTLDKVVREGATSRLLESIDPSEVPPILGPSKDALRAMVEKAWNKMVGPRLRNDPIKIGEEAAKHQVGRITNQLYKEMDLASLPSVPGLAGTDNLSSLGKAIKTEGDLWEQVNSLRSAKSEAVPESGLARQWLPAVVDRVARHAAERGYDGILLGTAQEAHEVSSMPIKGARLIYEKKAPKLLKKYGREAKAKINGTTYKVFLLSDESRQSLLNSKYLIGTIPPAIATRYFVTPDGRSVAEEEVNGTEENGVPAVQGGTRGDLGVHADQRPELRFI